MCLKRVVPTIGKNAVGFLWWTMGVGGNKPKSLYPSTILSMDWFKGTSTGKHGFYHQIMGFPVNFPIIQFYDFNKKSLLVSPSAKSHCSRSFSWYKAFLSQQQGIQAETSMFRGVRPLLTSCFLFPLPDSLFIVALGKLKNRWDKSQTINTTTELASSFSNVTHPFWPQNQVYLLKSGVQQRDHSSFDMQKNRWFCWVQECSTLWKFMRFWAIPVSKQPWNLAYSNGISRTRMAPSESLHAQRLLRPIMDSAFILVLRVRGGLRNHTMARGEGRQPLPCHGSRNFIELDGKYVLLMRLWILVVFFPALLCITTYHYHKPWRTPESTKKYQLKINVCSKMVGHKFEI